MSIERGLDGSCGWEIKFCKRKYKKEKTTQNVKAETGAIKPRIHGPRQARVRSENPEMEQDPKSKNKNIKRGSTNRQTAPAQLKPEAAAHSTCWHTQYPVLGTNTDNNAAPVLPYEESLSYGD